MQAITIAVVAILAAAAAAAWSIEGCTDSACSNCTAMDTTGVTWSGNCASQSGVSYNLVCSGSNASFNAYANADCSGSALTSVSYTTGCTAVGSAGLKVSCGASAATAVVAVAAVVAALLF